MEDGALLDPEHDRVYRALIKLGAAGVGEVARRASVHHEDAARALHALRDQGLASERTGGTPVYVALAPDVALGDRLLRRQAELDDARRAVAALSEEFRDTAHRRDADRLVEIVHGRAALRSRLATVQAEAREEILWFCRANPLAMPGTENTEEPGALGRGVRYRAIYERDLLTDPGELTGIIDSVRLGEEARTLHALPVRLAIADRRTAICPLVPDGERDVAEPTAALVRRSELLDALLALFESHWERATPLRLAGGVIEEADADASEKHLLSLFVAGLPDNSIASQLGVSRRTVQRRLDRLMSIAGVDTRTGLAFQAARRGWL